MTSPTPYAAADETPIHTRSLLGLALAAAALFWPQLAAAQSEEVAARAIPTHSSATEAPPDSASSSPATATAPANDSSRPPAAGSRDPSADGPNASGRLLGESEVIRIALQDSPQSRIATAKELLADAIVTTAAPFLDPSISWVRETVQTTPSIAEDLYVATLPLDIARPLSERSLTAAEGAWVKAQGALTLNEIVLEALQGYYGLVIAQRRVEVLLESTRHLDEAARILASREAAGAASGYESSRLAIARELSASQLAEARGQQSVARARLAGILGLPPTSFRVSSNLSLLAQEPRAALAKLDADARRAVQEARAAERYAAEADERAAFSWIPTISLSGGVKRVTAAQQSGTGYIVGVSLELPIFDRGQAFRAEAEAQRALSSARTDALVRTIDIERETSLALYQAAREELERFESTTGEHVAALLRAAQSGYREGERSIVELLDAQRAQTDVAERRLFLLGRAKRAEARWRTAAGEFR